MDLSNRDIAFLVWLSALAAFALWHRETRGSVVRVVEMLRGSIAVLFATFAVYVAAAALVARQLGLWNTGLLKDTIAWYLVPGLVLLFGFSQAYEGRGYYGRTLVRAIGLIALVEAYVNLGAFPLWVELFLLPALVFLGAISAVAALKPETMVVKPIADGLRGVIGVAVLVGTGAYLVSQWPSLDKTQLGLILALPVWLTLATLPFIFVFSLRENYLDTFRRIDRETAQDPRARRRAKLAVLTSFGLRNREFHRFTGMAPIELAAAQSWGEARRIIAFRRAEARMEDAKKDLAMKRLSRYAGVEGTDWEGPPLDQREFAETKRALDRLAMFHGARFENGRYRTDLMRLVGGLLSDTFPEAEITMIVYKKGRSWSAWRRTVTGWCLGIGAAGPLPDLWTYEGREPPSGPPRAGSEWKPGGDFEDTESAG